METDPQAGQSQSNAPQGASEEQIDEALDESFPASDPPFWTLGWTAPPRPTVEGSGDPIESEPQQSR